MTTLDGGKMAACKVQVKSSIVPVASVSLKETSLSLEATTTYASPAYPSDLIYYGYSVRCVQDK